MNQPPIPCPLCALPAGPAAARDPACRGDRMARQLAAQCRILADVTRLKILFALEDGECCVKALAAALDTGPSNVCGHLAQLAWLGLVARRQQGNTVFYRLTDPAFCTAIRRVLTSADRG